MQIELVDGSCLPLSSSNGVTNRPNELRGILEENQSWTGTYEAHALDRADHLRSALGQSLANGLDFCLVAIVDGSLSSSQMDCTGQAPLRLIVLTSFCLSITSIHRNNNPRDTLVGTRCLAIPSGLFLFHLKEILSECK